tara:strand:- start:2786 stop:3193 length:408 start_codon:yes stop_codon:yes gene_type:complete
MKQILVLSIIILSMQGCFRGSNSTESEVSGLIMLDGKPLPEGTITFISANNTTHSAQGKIHNGEYVVTVPVGEKRVEVHASRWTGKPYKKYDIIETEQYLPAVYNEKSELTAEVKPGQSVQLNWELFSDIQKSGK